MNLFTVFLLDVFLAGAAQATLPFLFATATALLGVLLAVCKIVVSHILHKTNTNILSFKRKTISTIITIN